MKLRKHFFAIFLFVLCTLAAMCLGGCGVAGGFGGRNSSSSIEYKNENTVSLYFDYEENAFFWTHQQGVDTYQLYLENAEGKSYIVNRRSVEDMLFENGKVGFYAKSTLKERADALDGGFHALLSAYTDDNDLMWAIRVPFAFLRITNPTVDVMTGILSWTPSDGAVGYVLGGGEDAITVTEPQIDLTQTRTSDFCYDRVNICPIGAEGENWASLPLEDFRFMYALDTIDVRYSWGSIFWRHNTEDYSREDRYLAEKFSYEVCIQDGDKTFTDTTEGTNYEYYPETEHFSYSVRTLGYLDEENGNYCLPAQKVTREVPCLGSITDFAYEEANAVFAWADIEESRDFVITLEGEEIASQRENSISASLFDTYYGEKELRIVCRVNEDGYYKAFQQKVLFGTAPTLDLEYAEDKVAVNVSDCEEGVTACKIGYASRNYNESEVYTVTESTAYTTIDLPLAGGYYKVVATPVYREDILAVSRSVSDTVIRKDRPEGHEIRYLTTYSDPVLRLMNGGNYEYEIDGEITATSEQQVPIPAEFFNLDTEQEMVIRVRDMGRRDKSTLEFPSDWVEFKIRTLGLVENIRLEDGQIQWDYNGTHRPTFEFYINGGKWDTLTSTSRELEFITEGKHTMYVRMTANNQLVEEENVYYLNGGYSDSLLLYRLAKPRAIALTDSGTGISWTGDGNAEGYELSGAGQVQTLADTSFDFSEALKKNGTILIFLKAVGDGETTFDSETVTYTVTRDAALAFTLSNEAGRLSWTSEKAYPSMDYEVVAPSGKVVYAETGLTENYQTKVLQLGEDGAHTLRVNPAATLFEKEKVAYLKTGDGAYDCEEQTFYNAYYEYTVEEGMLHIIHQPALPTGSYRLSARVCRPNGEYKFQPSSYDTVGDFMFGHGAFDNFDEEGCWSLEPLLRTSSGKHVELTEYDNMFTFQAKTTKHIVNVKNTPDVKAKFNYIPAEKYYTVHWGELRETNRLAKEHALEISADCAVEGTQYSFGFDTGDGYDRYYTTENSYVIAYEDFLPVYVYVETNYFTTPSEFYLGGKSSGVVHKVDAIKENRENVSLHYSCPTVEGGLAIAYFQQEDVVVTVTHNGVTTTLTATPWEKNENYMMVSYVGTPENPLQDGDEVIFRAYADDADGLFKSDLVGVIMYYEA